MRLASVLPLLLVAFFSALSVARALTFVPVPDGALASDEHSECILVGNVTRVSDRFRQGKTRAVTRVYVTVSEVLKRGYHDDSAAKGRGHLQIGEEVVVVTPGGYDPDSDWRMHVPGTPEFSEGEKVLLFVHHKDVTNNKTLPIEGHHYEQPQQRNIRVLGIAHVSLGAFREYVPKGQAKRGARTEQTTFAVSELADARKSALRDFDGFLRFLKAHDEASRLQAQGKRGAMPQEGAGYLKQNIRMSETRPRVALQQKARWNTFDGEPRWCEFETKSTDWLIQNGGQPSNSPTAVYPGGAINEIDQAMNLFNDHAGTQIAYRRTGTTDITTGFQDRDGVNVVAYNDPNDEVDGTFSCNTGGVLAIGGWWSKGSCTFQGRSHWHIREGDVMMNNNIGCNWITLSSLAELYAHEFGHSLGFSHEPKVAEALMFPSLHNDGRGAALNADDEGIMNFLYASQSCVPPACSANACGTISSSCGPVNCGSCSGQQVCDNNVCVDPPQPECKPRKFKRYIKSSLADGMVDSNDRWDCSNRALTLMDSNKAVGLTFHDIDVNTKIGERIKRVQLNFIAQPVAAQSPGEVSVEVAADKSDRSALCGDGKQYHKRSLTDERVNWDVRDFDRTDRWWSSPNLKPVVNEMLELKGFSKDSALTFVIQPRKGSAQNGFRKVNAWDAFTYTTRLSVVIECVGSATVNATFPGPGCVPKTCSDFPGQCGAFPDGCGGITVPCTCSNPDHSCSIDSTCQACAPTTCADLGATCGTHPDGCGGELTCGSCDTITNGVSKVCFAGSNCLPSTCTPSDPCQPGECGTKEVSCLNPAGAPFMNTTLSCGACKCLPTLDCGTQTCGTINDGCGNIVSCGTCPVNAPCNATSLTCSGIECGENQVLQAGACICAPGFVFDGQSSECVDTSSVSSGAAQVKFECLALISAW